MLASLDRVLLGRQAEGVPSHRVEDIVPLEAAVAGEDIGGRVSLDMADMEAVAARVGEHVEHVELLRLGIESGVARIGGTEGIRFQPMLLPAGLEFRERIVLAGQGHLVRTEETA